MGELVQRLPKPQVLFSLVVRLTYKPGWSFSLIEMDRGQGCQGLTLVIRVNCVCSYDHTKQRTVLHYMPVPAAAYNRRSWQRWLLEQCLLVERHEACEFFTINGEKPYAPNHGDGEDPYTITEVRTPEDAAARPGTKVDA